MRMRSGTCMSERLSESWTKTGHPELDLLSRIVMMVMAMVMMVVMVMMMM
jgi:hypothetical protein